MLNKPLKNIFIFLIFSFKQKNIILCKKNLKLYYKPKMFNKYYNYLLLFFIKNNNLNILLNLMTNKINKKDCSILIRKYKYNNVLINNKFYNCVTLFRSKNFKKHKSLIYSSYTFFKNISFFNKQTAKTINTQKFYPSHLKTTKHIINFYRLFFNKNLLKNNFLFNTNIEKYLYINKNIKKSRLIFNKNINYANKPIYKKPINYINTFYFYKKIFLHYYLNILSSNIIYNKDFIYKFALKLKKSKFLLKYLILLKDFYGVNFFNKNISFISNKYLNNFLNVFSVNDLNLKSYEFFFKLKSNNKFFNNYYPIMLSNKKSYTKFFNNFKTNFNLNYLHMTNKFILSFFEFFFKKKFYLKLTNNQFNKIQNFYLNNLLTEYKNFQPIYFKNFLFLDFLKILWYSFILKDLKMLSDWISKFMETLNFKNHKKFINFFQNFINKNSSLFINILSIKGFFFDIRGKVGVTGSSKKRHLCFKFGSLNKSSKTLKINFNQNLVRTYSGVLGLTYIICY